MLLKDVVRQISNFSSPFDISQESLDVWHKHADVFPFLYKARQQDVPLQISSKALVAHSVIVPSRYLKGDYQSAFLTWNFTASSGYGYGIRYKHGKSSYYLSEPLQNSGIDILDHAIPVFFERYFPGYGKESHYVEMNQRLSHVLDLHWVEDCQAWSTWNDLGESVPVARYYDDNETTCYTLRRDKLDVYLFLSKSVLVQFFESARFLDGDIPGESTEESEHFNAVEEIFAHRAVYNSGNNQMSFMRGYQIIRPQRSSKEMALIVEGREPRNYATYLIFDWKHDCVVEWSCDPDRLGNYFTESELPFTTSPAFFKPEVLAQYQQDPSRYSIDERRVECKNAWSLRYDVNDEGQVFVYIYDFNKVPYEVQLHWKAFNEPPRSGISARAIKADFQGRFDFSMTALQSLKALLKNFPTQDSHGNHCQIWQLPKSSETRDLNTLNYVLTASKKEWEDQILTLAQLLVEGLNPKTINKLADALNCRDNSLGSIRQLNKVMEALGVDVYLQNIIIDPLLEIWKLRSSGIAHAGSSAISSDLRMHFYSTVEACERSMRMLAELIRSGTFCVS